MMFRSVCFFLLLAQCVWGDPQSADHSSQQFTFELMRQLDDKDKNLCLSPYSLSSALAMAFEGAKGRTREEMERVLRLSSDAGEISKSFSELNRWLNIQTIPNITFSWQILSGCKKRPISFRPF